MALFEGNCMSTIVIYDRTSSGISVAKIMQVSERTTYANNEETIDIEFKTVESVSIKL